MDNSSKQKKNKRIMVSDMPYASEWDYKKNTYNPNEVTYKSDKRVWWICGRCGHEWETAAKVRALGSGCPKCAEVKRTESKMKPKEGMSLKDKSPSLAEEWNYEKNDKNPEDFYNSSNYKVWWVCKHCGGEWEAAICDRVRGNGCPHCARMELALNKKKPDLGNSLEDLYPEISLEWNYEKNDKTPDQYRPRSNEKVWWICEKGHEWISSINNRTKGNGCPYCVGKKILKGENDFETLFPEIAAEWNYKKNSKTPDQYRPHSNEKVWWICNEGHEWQTTVNNRVYGNGCPFCSGRKVVKGKNDLATMYPELLKEWDYEKNTLDPSEVSFGSNERVWWRCKRGHEWQTTISNRTTLRRGCSLCSKELRTSFPELAIYYYVKKYFADVESGNRELLGGLELDVFIPSKKIAIEYDGVVWHKSSAAVAREKRKNGLCKQKGIRLIRIRESGLEKLSDCICVMRDGNDDYSLNKVIEEVMAQLDIRKPDIDIKRDRFEIYSLIDLSDKENSLQNRFPEIAAEWNYEKNGKLTPSMVSFSSNISVWWKCKEGHEWESNINNRLRVPVCPYCSGNKVMSGSNDLQTLYPELCKEWDYEKNGNLSPSMVLPHSQKKVWWKCSENHNWKASVAHRVEGTKCPKCARASMVEKRFRLKIEKKSEKKHGIAKAKSLEEVYPNIASEWNYEKNERKPSEYYPHSQQKVWWICGKGHEYEAKIGNRTSLNRGCPYCSGRYAIKGENDFETVYPELLKYWDYSKNIKKPSDVLPHSQKKVWWKCENGHSYQRVISSQILQNGKCPICKKQH